MRENDGVFPYKREKLLSGVREGGFEGVYGRVVCQVFLPCVVGTNHWRKNCSVNLLSEFCTTSDEVFCLFILENSYDMWVDGWKFKEQVKAGKEVSRRRKKEERVGPLYTVGSGSEARKYGGWSAAGIERWNVLFQLIKSERAKGDEFEIAFRKGMLEKRMSLGGESTSSNGSVKSKGSVTVDMLNDLDEYKYVEI